MASLTNKTALVTGASRGIGRATASALANAGAHVLVHYGPFGTGCGISRGRRPFKRGTRGYDQGRFGNSKRMQHCWPRKLARS